MYKLRENDYQQAQCMKCGELGHATCGYNRSIFKPGYFDDLYISDPLSIIAKNEEEVIEIDEDEGEAYQEASDSDESEEFEEARTKKTGDNYQPHQYHGVRDFGNGIQNRNQNQQKGGKNWANFKNIKFNKGKY